MIIFEQVKKTYPKELGQTAYTALSGLSFTAKKGEILGLIGANGAGKSTTIKLLMDFLRPDSGTITLFGKPPQQASLRRTIGYLPEIANLPANLTLWDLLHFAGRCCIVEADLLKKRGEILLERLHLAQDSRRPLRSYSKGMKQRANFALALINDPELLILDEPMSGLDPLGRQMVFDLISQLKHDGKTIFFCSHILEDVDRLADSVLLLHRGCKLFHGPPAQLTAEEQSSTMAEAFVRRVQREEGNV